MSDPVSDLAVPAFDHRERGTPESAWAGEPHLAACAPLALDALAHLVVVAAHPDDESLGAGGLVATAAASGARVDVVVATLGEASHPRSPTHTPAQLAALRREEVRAAVAALSARAHLHQLDLPDGALADHEGALAAVLDAVVTPGASLAAPWRADGHPDHEAAGRAAASLARRTGAVLLEYPVWAWHWAAPAAAEGGFAGRVGWHALRRLPLNAPARAAKAAAMAAHTSQVRALSPAPGDEPVVAAWFSAHFERDHETFVVGCR